MNSSSCCPQINTATSTEFELLNTNKQSNFILGSVANGELTFLVENLPKTTPHTGCPGWWMFGLMMDHFQMSGTAIHAIAGSWTYGDNLTLVNRFTGGSSPLTLEEAAKQTISGRYAASRQYTKVTVSSFAGTPGNFTRVRVLFKS